MGANSNIQEGGTIVVIGDGPIGQSSVLASQLFNPEQVVLVGRHEGRLDFGRDKAGAKISVLGFGHLFGPVDQPYTASLFRNLTIHTGVVNVA